MRRDTRIQRECRWHRTGTLHIQKAIPILRLEKKTRFYQASTSEFCDLAREQPEDFVIATSVQYSARQFVAFSARELGIEPRFDDQGDAEIGVATAVTGGKARCKVGDVIVTVDPRHYRPTEVETLLGDPHKATQKLGWAPKITLPEQLKAMVEADYYSAKRDSLVKRADFQAYDYPMNRTASVSAAAQLAGSRQRTSGGCQMSRRDRKLPPELVEAPSRTRLATGDIVRFEVLCDRQ